MYTETNTAEPSVTEFDVNDPQLGSYVPDEVDPNSVPVKTYPPPPSDGVNTIVLRLNDRREGGPVYQKGEKNEAGQIIDGMVIASFRVRFLNEDGTEGSYLKDWYATSYLMKGQKASDLSGLAYLSGRPYPEGRLSLDRQQAHIERLFAEAPDGAITFKAKTVWVKSHQKVDAVGMPLFKKNKDGSDRFDRKGNLEKDYYELKGQKRIQKLATIAALEEVKGWEPREGQTPEQFQKEKDDWVASAADRAHIFIDPVSGNDLQVQVEIDQLVDE